jgi:hypothetical protein
MAADGKYLEALVAYGERTLLPEGFTVATNERIFNDEGVQIAEFDIEIRGKVGSTAIVWLIECSLLDTAEYRHTDTSGISQVASFAPQSIFGMKFSTEMHKMRDTGETHVILRRLADNA